MSNERDTHFQGFAKLLWHEVRKTSFDSPGFSEYQRLERYLQLLIAQRAYDLLIHDRMNTGTSDLQHAASYYEAEELVNGIPDLDAWPEPRTE